MITLIIIKDGILQTLNVSENDSSYRYRALTQTPRLELKFTLSEYTDIPIGASCVYQGEKYVLLSPPNIKKNGERNIEYTLEMGTDADNLRMYRFRNAEDKRLKFSMCAKPSEFLRQIIINLNNHDGEGVWTAGKCIDAVEKTIEFNHTDILSALSSVAEAFETEWEVSSHVISLCKIEYNKDAPLPLSYGKGNGFIPGVGRLSAADSQPIGNLYVQGGEKNINPSKYKSKYLLLPISQKFTYEGNEYISSSDGLSVCNVKNQGAKTLREDSLDLSEIYPKRVGKISSVETKSVDKHFYDILDSSIPDTLNYSKHLIEGEKMSIIFQSGMLAGKEFDVKYKHAERRFEIVPQEYDGVTMPDETFKPAIGNEYAVYNVALPDAYICDNATKSGASWDMMREACKYLKEHEEQKFTFSGELQGLWAKKNWVNIGGKLKVGGYIRFSDPQFAPNGIDIRIVGIKDYLSEPHAPILELSNEPKGASFSSIINKIEQQEVVIEEGKRDVISFTKRNFRDAKETLSMLQGALSDFSGAINPVSISTMAMLVGDESLQFRFVKSKTNLTQVTHNITYDKVNKQLHCPRGFLQHMTLGINDISSNHSDKEYKVWDMNDFLSPHLADPKKKYYLYAKVSHDTSVRGDFILSENPIRLNELSEFYHLLTGMLNSEYDGDRSYVNLYGFTEVLPGRITTGRVVSGDGTSYFDLVANAFRLGDKLSYNVNGDNLLRLKGTLVQSNSGQENFIGCYRGLYNNSDTYFDGDEVTYTDAHGLTSTYRYIFATPTTGVTPDNLSYWQVIAQGAHGADGNSPAMVYRGNYSDSEIYYGTPHRVDVVKAGSMYYVAKTDAGEPFTKVPPPNEAYWNLFGAKFDSIATGLLLAEGANIANFVFANQRMESQGKTGEVPNIILDGLRNYASFAGGKVHFDRDIAKIAWLEIVGNDLVGYDDDRNVRLRISNTELPSVASLSSTSTLNCIVTPPSDATYDELKGEVIRQGWREERIDPWNGTTYDEQNTVWVDLKFSIDQDDTMVDFEFQVRLSESVAEVSVSESISVYKVADNKQVGTSDKPNLTIKLNRGDYKVRFWSQFNTSSEWNANMLLLFRLPNITRWAQQTYIGNNGILVTGGGNYLKQTTDSFEVSVGNNGLKVDNSGVQKQINGKWSNL